METQKMPSGLRRNSLVSLFSSHPSSREGSRRNSQSGDEKRLSGISLSSFATGRSQSTPATTDEPPTSFDKFRSSVSPTAPQLPSFSWKSRRGSNETSRGVSWVSEDAYDKEVVEFAYRLDASAFIAESEKIEKKRSQNQQPPRKSQFKEHTELNGFSRSAIQPTLMNSKSDTAVLKAPPKSPPRAETTHQAGSVQTSARQEEAKTNTQQRSPKANQSNARQGHTGSEPPLRAAKERDIESPEQVAPQKRSATYLRPSHDGSSYVQKQRRYQQQMSIAGFEDQQTVQRANELAAENENAVGVQRKGAHILSELSIATPLEKAATPRAQYEYRQDSQETIVSRSPEIEHRRHEPQQSNPSAARQPQKATPLSQSTKADDVPNKPSPDTTGVNLSRAQDAKTPDAQAPEENPPPTEPKSNKTLGFRKRTKPPPSKIWISQGETTSKSDQQPMSAPPAQPLDSASKRSKMEKMFIDPLAAQISFRKRAGSAGSVTLAPPPKELFRTHTRNRTNSSEALTADLPSPVPWSNRADVAKAKPGRSKGESSPWWQEQKYSVENMAEVDSGVVKPRSQSSGSIGVATSESMPKHPYAASGELMESSKQISSTPVEQNTSDVKELTRYQLVETIDPRAIKSKASTPAESGPSQLSSPNDRVPMTTSASIGLPLKPVTGQVEKEVKVASVGKKDLSRKASIAQSQSNPQLQTQSTVTNSLPSLDFLPQLKHQPLVKKNSPPRTSVDSTITVPQLPSPSSPGSASTSGPASSLGSPSSSSPATSRLLTSTTTPTIIKPPIPTPIIQPRSPLRPPQSHPSSSTTTTTTTTTTPNSPLKYSTAASPSPPPESTSTSKPRSLSIPLPNVNASIGISKSTPTLPTTPALPTKPVAKLFVICCTCHYWHDLPSKLYEAIALPQTVSHPSVNGNGTHNKGGEVEVYETAVRCPWCEHPMTTACCQGWTGVVYLRARHH